MKKDDAVRALTEVVGDTTLSCVEASLVGSLAIIDEIAADFKNEVCGKIRRMYEDRAYYIERGGWSKFTMDENRQYLEKAFDEFEKQGYEFDSLDFYDDTNGVLFLNLTEVKKQC